MIESVTSKIQKLLAHAESAEALGNSAEADAFNAQAERLMIKYAVDEAMLQAAGKKKVEEIVLKTFHFKGVFGESESMLVARIAMGLGLKCVIGKGYGTATYTKVVGYESDQATLDILFASLTLQSTSGYKAAWLPYKRTGAYTPYERQQFIRSFLIAFGNTVQTRLQDLKRIVVDETPGAALVLVSKEDKVKAAASEHFGQTKAGRARKISNVSGYTSGREAAAKADIGQNRVGGNRTALTHR